MKTLFLSKNFYATFLFINKKKFIILKKENYASIYFLIPKILKIQICKNIIVTKQIKYITLMTIFEKLLYNLKYGIKKKLIVLGIGYKIYKTNNKKNIIQLNLGFSHNILFKFNNINITITMFKLKRVSNRFILIIKGYNCGLVTQIASKIKNLKKNNIYNGTGIFYKNQKIKKKKFKKK